MRTLGARGIRVVVTAVAEGAIWWRSSGAWLFRRPELKTHNVVKLVVVIIGGDFDAIPGKLLINSSAECFARFRPKRKIARITGITAVGLVEARLLIPSPKNAR